MNISALGTTTKKIVAILCSIAIVLFILWWCDVFSNSRIIIEQRYETENKRTDIHKETISVDVKDAQSEMSLRITVVNDHVNDESTVGFGARVYPKTIGQLEVAIELYEVGLDKAYDLADYEVVNE